MQFIPLANLETVARVTRQSMAGGFSDLTWAWSFPVVPVLDPDTPRCSRCRRRRARFDLHGLCGDCFQDRVEWERMKSYGYL